MILLLMVTWIFLLIAGIPVAVSLGLISLIYCLLNGIPLHVLPGRMIGALDSFLLLAVPLFILAGRLMNRGGITDRIFNFARALVGHIPGGLGHVNVVASIIFAGMSGSSIADIGGLGTIEIKAMKDAGFPLDFSAAVTHASSTIGPIIPPSIPVILYAMLANVSVAGLFAGGIIPGLIMGVTLMIFIYFISLKKKFPVEKRASFHEILRVSIRAIPALLSPIIIVGGVLFGVMTPTESACVAVIYTLFLGVVYRKIKLSGLLSEALATIKITANVLFIFSTASLFAWVLTRERVPQMVAEFLSSVSSGPSGTILFIILVVLALGCFMEGLALMIILVPIFAPAAAGFNMDLIHVGIVIIIAMMLGSLTPPFGAGLFATAQVAGISYERMVKAVYPFLFPLFGALFIVAYVPNTVNFLSRFFMR